MDIFDSVELAKEAEVILTYISGVPATATMTQLYIEELRRRKVSGALPLPRICLRFPRLLRLLESPLRLGVMPDFRQRLRLGCVIVEHASNALLFHRYMPQRTDRAVLELVGMLLLEAFLLPVRILVGGTWSLVCSRI